MSNWGWNYPPGMTKSDWAYLEGTEDRECPECATSVHTEDQEWDDECPVCGTLLPTVSDEGPDPDRANDERREREWDEANNN